MEKTILKGELRTDAPKKVRAAGFTPGVLNESDTTSTSVQFETIDLNKIIAHHGTKAKIWISLDGKEHFGVMKEVQRDPITRKILHVSILLIKQDQEVKINVPIYFHGKEDLEHQRLLLQILKTETELSGKATLIPEKIEIDVAGKQLGEHIMAEDFHLAKDIKVLDDENEIYATVKELKEIQTEEPEAASEETAEADAEKVAETVAEE
jgi:large subunit ribosomal protein L25